MRIQRDLDSNAIQYRKPFPRQTTRQQNVPSSQQRYNRNISEKITSRLQKERSLNNALSIAQLSHQLIQKAMVISSQLRNIALNAMESGSINQDELHTTIAEINSSFSQHYQGTAGVIQPVTPINPDIKTDLKGIIQTAEEMNTGTVPPLPHFDNLSRIFNKKMSAIENEESHITTQIKDTQTKLFNSYNIKPNVLIDKTRNSVMKNPSRALSVQGNLNHTQAQKIIMG